MIFSGFYPTYYADANGSEGVLSAPPTQYGVPERALQILKLAQITLCTLHIRGSIIAAYSLALFRKVSTFFVIDLF